MRSLFGVYLNLPVNRGEVTTLLTNNFTEFTRTNDINDYIRITNPITTTVNTNVSHYFELAEKFKATQVASTFRKLGLSDLQSQSLTEKIKSDDVTVIKHMSNLEFILISLVSSDLNNRLINVINCELFLGLNESELDCIHKAVQGSKCTVLCATNYSNPEDLSFIDQIIGLTEHNLVELTSLANVGSLRLPKLTSQKRRNSSDILEDEELM